MPQLPFELAALPFRFFQTIRLPVVSYALPALIAIGLVRHAQRPSWNPLTRPLPHGCASADVGEIATNSTFEWRLLGSRAVAQFRADEL